MKIGVTADTHSHEIPEELIEALKEVDLIIHAGDFCSKDDLKIFEKIGPPVKAVYGNLDDSDVTDLLPEEQIFKYEGKKIGLYHGSGAAKKVFELVQERFVGRQVDIVIFGHSHHPMIEVVDGVFYLNPGSPNDSVIAPYCSYALIDIHDNTIEAEIVKLS